MESQQFVLYSRAVGFALCGGDALRLEVVVGERSPFRFEVDRSHFGALYGSVVLRVAIHSPRGLAEALGLAQGS